MLNQPTKTWGRLLSAMIALLLAGCSTQAQRQFQTMKAGNEQAGAEFKACVTTAYNSPENAPVRAHVPGDVDDATLQQLADPAFATPNEIQAAFAVHPQIQSCRKAFVVGLTKSEPAVVPTLISTFNKADDDLLALTQRKIAWGEYVHHWRDRAAESRQAVQAVDQQVIAGLKEEHQAEVAQRQRAAEALAQWAQTQQLINAANRPVITNCNRFGSMVNCVSQ